MRSLVLSAVLALSTLSRAATADEVAPGLETNDRRVLAQAELTKLTDAEDRARFPGMYVAIDSDPATLVGQVACDDDGDYVVVLSDALLELAAHLARLSLLDAADPKHRLEDYGRFVGIAQVPGKKLLPPPPAMTVNAPVDRPLYEARLRDVLAYLVARELVRFRAGDLVCPNPTATKEIGDDVWTAEERRAATEVARRVYPRNSLDRNTAGEALVESANHDPRGMIAVTMFFRSLVTSGGRFAPNYAAMHHD